MNYDLLVFLLQLYYKYYAIPVGDFFHIDKISFIFKLPLRSARVALSGDVPRCRRVDKQSETEKKLGNDHSISKQ